MSKTLNIFIIILILITFSHTIYANTVEYNIKDNINNIKIKQKSINIDKKYSSYVKNSYNLTNYIEKTSGNKLISKDNPLGEDSKPKITRNSDGIIVIAYEKKSDSNNITNPIMFSYDNGENWNMKFDISSNIFNMSKTMSGITIDPDIVYNPNLDVFYYASIDPDAEIYNNVMGFIDGDIYNAQEVLMYATSACGDDYLEVAVTTTNNYFLSGTIRDGFTQNKYLNMYYFTYPDFEQPPVMSGYYSDEESIHKTSPASNIEMDTANRIYIVSESEIEDDHKITIKSTSSDENLLTNGEMQNGMDKYADITQWSGEYIDYGSDPDVSAFGNKVFVLYNQNNIIKCAYSTAESGYGPEFNWHISNIDYNGSCPAVYAIGEKIICAYIKEGNLYIRESMDGGASWEDPYQVNEVEGSVVEENGSIDLNDVGIVWADIRDGTRDIYFQSIKQQDIFIPKISISGGLGFTITFENLGNLSKTNLKWNVTIDVPFLFFGEITQEIISLDAYDSVDIHANVFGLGKIFIEVECEYGGYERVSGFILGPFVFI
jgi:hypothetical protein